MKRSVFWSVTALDDFESVISYIAARNPSAAQKVADAVRKSGNELGNFAVGRYGRIEGTYEKTINGLPFIMAYTIQMLPEGDENIIILHIIHGARDWPPGKWPT